MLYTKRTVKCSAARLSRDDARESLVRQFEGDEIIDFKRRGDKWVATILQKKAEFPPKSDDDSSDSPPPFEDDGPQDPDSDGPPKPDDGPPSDDSEGDGPPKGKKGESAELGVLLEIVTQIADKLGIMPPGDPAAPGAEDPMGPPDGPPGPPGAGGPPPGPPGGGSEVLHRTKLKPGETPPGGTPVGAPAFASTDLSRLASFDAFDDTPGKSIKQAHAELTSTYGPQGFVVRQIKRVDNGQRLAAKLSRR